MGFDLHKIFIDDFDWLVALEILLRTFVMFVMVLVLLRLSGKKGVRQLSLFEVAIIISLGSAAGDPMFNDDSPILPALLVFAVVLGIYRVITWLTASSEKAEMLFEGIPTYIIEDGMFVLESENKHTFAKDEFMAEMRQQNIEHLGQVKTALLETTGNVSFIYYADEDVKPGMPVYPKAYSKMSTQIDSKGNYACTYCGHVESLKGPAQCARCGKDIWVSALQTSRLS